MLVHDEQGREIGRFPIDWDSERMLLDYGTVRIACPLPPYKGPASVGVTPDLFMPLVRIERRGKQFVASPAAHARYLIAWHEANELSRRVFRTSLNHMDCEAAQAERDRLWVTIQESAARAVA